MTDAAALAAGLRAAGALIVVQCDLLPRVWDFAAGCVVNKGRAEEDNDDHNNEGRGTRKDHGPLCLKKKERKKERTSLKCKKESSRLLEIGGLRARGDAAICHVMPTQSAVPAIFDTHRNTKNMKIFDSPFHPSSPPPSLSLSLKDTGGADEALERLLQRAVALWHWQPAPACLVLHCRVLAVARIGPAVVWSRRLSALLFQHIYFVHMSLWLSTLGGAYSALGSVPSK